MGGFHPGPASHFLGLPLGLLGAPPAMPLLNGPALSTALLQLALQTQSQKVTAGRGATGSLLTHIPQPLVIPFPTPLVPTNGWFTVSGVVDHQTVSMGPGLSQVLRTQEVTQSKLRLHRGVEGPLIPTPSNTHTHTHNTHTHWHTLTALSGLIHWGQVSGADVS